MTSRTETTTAWADRLASIRRNREAGRGWRDPATKLATAMREAGEVELSRLLMSAVSLGGKPSQHGRLEAVLRDLAGRLAVLSAPAAAPAVVTAEVDTTPDWTPAQRGAPGPPAPRTVVPTRYAPDGITVLQERAAGVVTLLVQMDGRDLQALALTPELATHLLHGLLDHASRPRLDGR